MRTIDFKIVNQEVPEMAKSNDKMVANNKRHIMIILSWIRSRQELLCTEQK